MDRYAQAWERFVSGGFLEFGGHMDPTWQKGRSLAASFVVPVDATRLRPRLDPIRESLKLMPFVTLHPDHFMHITILPLGFLVPDPQQRDEVSPERLTEVEAEARKALETFPAFSVELANLNAFPGAAFIEVHDGGRLDKLRDVLCDSCGLQAPGGLAHLTLAYFHAPDGSPAPRELVSTIARFRAWPVGEVPVDGIDLTLLDLNAEYPAPERFARLHLKKT